MAIFLTGRSRSKYSSLKTTIKALVLFFSFISIIPIFVFNTSPLGDEIPNTPTTIRSNSSHSKVSERDYSTAATEALRTATAIIQNVSFDIPTTISLESSKGERERERDGNNQHSDHRMTLLLLHYPFFIMFSFLIQAMRRSPILFYHNK